MMHRLPETSPSVKRNAPISWSGTSVSRWRISCARGPCSASCAHSSLTSRGVTPLAWAFIQATSPSRFEALTQTRIFSGLKR